MMTVYISRWAEAQPMRIEWTGETYSNPHDRIEAETLRIIRNQEPCYAALALVFAGWVVGFCWPLLRRLIPLVLFASIVSAGTITFHDENAADAYASVDNYAGNGAVYFGPSGYAMFHTTTMTVATISVNDGSDRRYGGYIDGTYSGGSSAGSPVPGASLGFDMSEDTSALDIYLRSDGTIEWFYTAAALPENVLNILSVASSVMVLGVISGSLIFASRFLWRLFHNLLGGPTWRE